MRVAVPPLAPSLPVPKCRRDPHAEPVTVAGGAQMTNGIGEEAMACGNVELHSDRGRPTEVWGHGRGPPTAAHWACASPSTTHRANGASSGAVKGDCYLMLLIIKKAVSGSQWPGEWETRKKMRDACKWSPKREYGWMNDIFPSQLKPQSASATR